MKQICSARILLHLFLPSALSSFALAQAPVSSAVPPKDSRRADGQTPPPFKEEYRDRGVSNVPPTMGENKASSVSPPSTGAPACMYAINFDISSNFTTKLFKLNPATGAIISTINITPSIGSCIGLELASNGSLYTVTTWGGSNNINSLYKIDPATGASQLIGPLGAGISASEGDLAFDPSGTLYGVSGTTLFTVSLATGAATVKGTVLGVSRDISNLAFTPSGTLYAIDNRIVSGSQTILLTLLTDATIVASQNVAPNLRGWGGMDFDPLSNLLYIADGQTGVTSKYYRLDPQNGIMTLIGPTGVTPGVSGLAICQSPLEQSDKCCQGTTLSATGGVLTPAGAGSYSFNPTLKAAPPNTMKVRANVIGTSIAHSSTSCGVSGPTSSYVINGNTVAGFTAPTVSVPNGREVSWASANPLGTDITGGKVFPFKIQLPTPPALNCSDTITFWVKYTFTDAKCTTCERISCYSFKRFPHAKGQMGEPMPQLVPCPPPTADTHAPSN